MSGYFSKKILVVDDEEEIRSLVRETLMVDDFNVVEAEDGDRALNMIANEAPIWYCWMFECRDDTMDWKSAGRLKMILKLAIYR